MTKITAEAEKEGIKVIEDGRIGRLKGLYVEGFIVINPNIETTAEKICILGEELGHHYTSYGNILDQTKIENRKQERRARAWAYEKLAGPEKLVAAFEYGVKNRHELAEYLCVTEEFVEAAISYFQAKYWPCYITNGYRVMFRPLYVTKDV